MSIKDYSTTASSNGTVYFEENMSPADVNNDARSMMADIREWYENPEFRDLGDTPTFASATTFTISGDVTANYVANQRIECFGSTMGTLYGTIQSSSYLAPNTTITVTLDSGTLTSNLSRVSIGLNPSSALFDISAIEGAAELSAGNTFSGNNTFSGDTTLTGDLNLPSDGELTIASGSITTTGSNHSVDTEGDAATDDLDTIVAGSDGQLLLLTIADDARDVVVKHGTGNIVTPNGEDITIDTTAQKLLLSYDGANWTVVSSFNQKALQAEAEAGSGTGLMDATLVGQAIAALTPTDTVVFAAGGLVSSAGVLDVDAYGVASTSNAGTGIYTVILSVTMANTKYRVYVDAENAGFNGIVPVVDNKTTTSFRIRTLNNATSTAFSNVDFGFDVVGVLA